MGKNAFSLNYATKYFKIDITLPTATDMAKVSPSAATGVSSWWERIMTYNSIGKKHQYAFD